MHEFQSLAPVKWDCKYHVVFIPKYRRKVLYGKLRAAVGRIRRELCEQNGIGLLEGPAAVDHSHLFLSIPPRYSVAYTVGFLKGKSAVRVHRDLLWERRMTGLHFWATGYWASSVGRDEETVGHYTREQEGWDRQQGELSLNKRGFRAKEASGAAPIPTDSLRPTPMGGV
ncbi:MAG TPA: IS200/IS605 family transposase [Gemmataceae bacterium]|nr:IS200/IS605 family transposase [Gemmataceae bacterium]